MTKSQLHLYDKILWPKYTRILKARGYSSADLKQERADLYIRALGSRISSRKWTNAQFQLVIQELNLLLDPANLNAAGETPEQIARRIHYRAIMALGFPPEYLVGMLRRYTKNPEADDLDILTLEQLPDFNQKCQIAARKGYAKCPA